MQSSLKSFQLLNKMINFIFILWFFLIKYTKYKII